jgi:hypothetical protein
MVTVQCENNCTLGKVAFSRKERGGVIGTNTRILDELKL